MCHSWSCSTPANLRYAADWREFPIYQSKTQVYDLFVTHDGELVMFGAYGSQHPGIADSRPTHALNVFDGGLDLRPQARRFAADVAAFVGNGEGWPWST